MTRDCPRCGKPFAFTGRAHPQRWCSPLCRKEGNREGIRWTDPPPAPPFPLTDLNIATTARYAWCRGRHVFGEHVIVREVGGKDHVMRICDRCEVPIPIRYQLWNGKVSVKGYSAA